MKILILSCDIGERHNSAAYAILEALQDQGEESEVINALAFGGKISASIVASSYRSIARNIPSAFGLVYKAGDLYSSTKLTSPIYFVNSLYAKNLFEYIREKNFDAVICTHLFAMEAMTYIRRKYQISAKCYGVLTDYICVPFFEETELDTYFIPHQDILKECVAKGMPENRIFATGIPVCKKFSCHMDQSEARNYLVIPAEKKMYLIMTGGMGYGNVLELCNALLKDRHDEISVNVLVARNSTLKESIDERYRFDDRVRSVTFTEKVNIYMNAADVLLSKPGGISSTEAAVANIPIIHTTPILGCETKNAEFFANRGMSMKAKTDVEAASLAYILAYDSNKAEKMRNMQQAQINPNAASDIVTLIRNQ